MSANASEVFHVLNISPYMILIEFQRSVSDHTVLVFNLLHGNNVLRCAGSAMYPAYHG